MEEENSSGLRPIHTAVELGGRIVVHFNTNCLVNSGLVWIPLFSHNRKRILAFYSDEAMVLAWFSRLFQRQGSCTKLLKFIQGLPSISRVSITIPAFPGRVATLTRTRILAALNSLCGEGVHSAVE